MNKTYSEVFDQVMPRAVRLMMRRVRRAQATGKDVIWDQTSTTVASRVRKLLALFDYQHVAVVFRTPAPEELQHRLNTRPGKVIPKSVLNLMIDQFELPTPTEGFEEIWYAE
jgi:predicted kinase